MIVLTKIAQTLLIQYLPVILRLLGGLKTMTMNVNLTSELVKFVQRRVKAGRYNSASEVVRDALRKELEAEERRHEMDRRIDEGMASKSIDGEAAFKRIYAHIAKRKKERARVARIAAKKVA